MSAYDSACHPLNIFVHKDGQQFGPFTFGEIRHELNIGTFSPADLAWREGFSDWVPLRSIVNSTETTEARSFAAPAAVLAPKKKQCTPFIIVGCAIAIVSVGLLLAFGLLSHILYPYGRLPGEYVDRISGQASGVNVSYCGLWSFSNDGSLTLSQQTFVGNNHVNDLHFTGTYSIKGNVLTALISAHSNSPFIFQIERDGTLVDAKDRTRRMSLEETRALLKNSGESLTVALKELRRLKSLVSVGLTYPQYLRR